jgi:hypothetical protein
MAGYPGTPLPKKLGIKTGHKVCLLNAPGGFERHLTTSLALESDEPIRITHDLRLPPVDVVVLFVNRIADLERRFADIAARLHPEGGFWVAFRSVRGSDITEDVVRRIALAAGMVDNKLCAFDTAWSAMRLVLRNEIRDAVMYRAAPPAPTLSRRMRRPTAPARIAHRTLSRASGAGSTMRRARARSTK